MFTRNLIDRFWSAVSKSVDAPNHHIARSHEEAAIRAFCDIIYFCETFDPDYKAGPADLAFELASVINNDFDQSFDLEETLPDDIYKRGQGISRVATRAYHA